MRSSTGGVAQTFYDVGRGISEADSVRLYLQDTKSTAVYRFPLPEAEYKTIRFDPLDHGNADLIINYARIVDVFGHTLRRFPLGELRVANGISASEIKDAGMSLTLGPADNDSNLIINPGTPWTSYGAFGPVALRRPHIPALLSTAGCSGLFRAASRKTPRKTTFVEPDEATLVSICRMDSTAPEPGFAARGGHKHSYQLLPRCFLWEKLCFTE